MPKLVIKMHSGGGGGTQSWNYNVFRNVQTMNEEILLVLKDKETVQPVLKKPVRFLTTTTTMQRYFVSPEGEAKSLKK